MKIRVVALLAVLTLALSACGSKTEDQDPANIGDKTTITQVNPLTGTVLNDGEPENPVFVVKIDNTRPSAPQTGIDKADLVVEQTVEGGVTRLAVMYWTNLPTEVGHVRSMRATDIGIVKPTNGQLAASGGAGVTIKRIGKAGIKIHSHDAGSTGFRRGPGYAPYNVLLDVKALASSAQGSGPSKPYFQWDNEGEIDSNASPDGSDGTEPTAPVETKTAKEVAVQFSRSHTTRWELTDGRWKRTNGTSQPEFGAENLIVMYASQRDAGYRDPAGSPVPETYFAGEGKYELFDGEVYSTGTWSKIDTSSTIVLKDANGQDVKMPVGKTWIELVNDGIASVSFN